MTRSCSFLSATRRAVMSVWVTIARADPGPAKRVTRPRNQRGASGAWQEDSWVNSACAPASTARNPAAKLRAAAASGPAAASQTAR